VGGSSELVLKSGVLDARPSDIVVRPVLFEGETLGVIEFASIATISDLYLSFLDRLVATIGVALKTIQANRRTEELLAQSQRLARELQEQSAELQRTNAELEEKAALLSEQKGNIEMKNREIELARTGLEEKAQQLAQASQYKSEFLANISHELRTPLNSMLVLSRLLADDPERNLTTRQIEFAQTIHGAGSDLLVLIDDILDLSKIEAGRMDVEPGTFSFTELSSYVEQAFRPQAEEKGLTLTVALDPKLPPAMITDAQRLQQILRNLLSNAVKFTEAGTVTLSIDLAKPGMSYGVGALDLATRVVAFTVTDTGVGISADKLSLIFEAFQQADGTTSRRYGGTGLGLSISRQLARLLGGSMVVTSTVGEGSAFTLYLPDLAGSDALPTAGPVGTTERKPNPIVRGEGSATSAQSLRGGTVLVIDDDVRNVFALTSALELHGMTVLYADNGADGVRMLEERGPVDIILMDAMMPAMDGNETTRAIRQNNRFADLPIVFLTAKAMPGDRESSLAAGASDYITKPVDLDDLLELMSHWVGANSDGAT
jgi:signal transduction histidine kinase/ActR/RegA family two-component response regulator